jgi:hypothetical protein
MGIEPNKLPADCVCACGYDAAPDDPCPQCEGTVPFRAHPAECACPICGMEFDNETDCYEIHLPDCEAEQEENADD